MRVFLTGGTGAIGRFLVPQLVEGGHEVIGLVRSEPRGRTLDAMGARFVIADPLNREELSAVVRRVEPEVIIHQLTALAGAGNFKKLDEEFALTNRFRTEVTDALLAAGREAGTRRFIAQSFCGWPFAREGGPVKTEDAPLDPDPPHSFRNTLAAIRHLEGAVKAATDLEALALRYGIFYGPGTSIAVDGSVGEEIRRRRIPIVGSGAGVWSFIHIGGAARATAAALQNGQPGIYNIVDDDPAPVTEWLPALAKALDAKPPRKVPAWIGKLAIGEGGVSMMTRIRGGSNAKAKRELRWSPRFSSWRQGFVEGLR